MSKKELTPEQEKALVDLQASRDVVVAKFKEHGVGIRERNHPNVNPPFLTWHECVYGDRISVNDLKAEYNRAKKEIENAVDKNSFFDDDDAEPNYYHTLELSGRTQKHPYTYVKYYVEHFTWEEYVIFLEEVGRAKKKLRELHKNEGKKSAAQKILEKHKKNAYDKALAEAMKEEYKDKSVEELLNEDI